MDIESFTITLGLGLLSGILLGIFGKQLFQSLKKLLFRIYATPKHLRKYQPEAAKFRNKHLVISESDRIEP